MKNMSFILWKKLNGFFGQPNTKRSWAAGRFCGLRLCLGPAMKHPPLPFLSLSLTSFLKKNADLDREVFST